MIAKSTAYLTKMAMVGSKYNIYLHVSYTQVLLTQSTTRRTKRKWFVNLLPHISTGELFATARRSSYTFWWASTSRLDVSLRLRDDDLFIFLKSMCAYYLAAETEPTVRETEEQIPESNELTNPVISISYLDSRLLIYDCLLETVRYYFYAYQEWVSRRD
jgi:hypothetical protein